MSPTELAREILAALREQKADGLFIQEDGLTFTMVDGRVDFVALAVRLQQRGIDK